MKKILLLILAAIVITLLTPNRALIDMTLHKGELWTDETLIAPFDIPILKSSSSLEQEKEDIIKNFAPIFRIDTISTNRKIESLLSILKHKQIDQSIIDSISGILFHASSIGIIPSNEAQKYSDKIIRISDAHNDLSSMPIAELFTPEKLAGMLQGLGVDVPQILDYIKPNLTYSDKLNKEIRDNVLSNISTTRSMVRTGETIVSNGQVIDQQTFQVLRSFLLEYETQIGLSGGIFWLMLGRFLLILIILFVNLKFFSNFAKYYFGAAFYPWLFLMLLYVLMAAFMAVVVNLRGVSPYVVPLPIVAIYLMNYFNMRVAILGNVTAAVICSLFVRIPFDFFLVNFVAGMVAILMMRHHYHRYNLFKALGVIFISQILVYCCLSLLREADIFAINYTRLMWFVLNAFLILGFYQAVYLIERFFGFVSDTTLLELCDTNQPLLLQLAEKAPGTFQHSVQVANLAEAAAKEIGANPLLARTGAMYHDIGKMENPFYYTENQTGGFNPHDDLTPLESVDIIKNHVTDGVATANKKRLPKQITDFITGHHGTSKMYFFYSKQKALNGGPVDDPSQFCYPGPKPVSKEVAICMMADAVEASSRSLKSYDKEPLEALVDRIIEIQISEHQLADSEITFREVEQIKALFKAKLNTIYHARISYPERNN